MLLCNLREESVLRGAPETDNLTDQIFEEDFDLSAFVSEPAGHPLPHLQGGADDSASHDGAKVLHHHPPVHLRHQQLVRGAVHPLVLLKVVFDQSFNLLQWLCVTEPLSLHQPLKEWLTDRQRDRQAGTDRQAGRETGLVSFEVSSFIFLLISGFSLCVQLR